MQWVTDPMREFERMRKLMDKMFSRVPFFGTTEFQFPLVNLYDARDVLYVVAEIPGVPKENIEINYQDGALTITGKREFKRYGQSELLRQEQPEGDFEKIIRIPMSIKSNEIKAKFEDGMLTVSLPKTEEAKPRQIAVEF
jgi:HSP20 family protein